MGVPAENAVGGVMVRVGQSARGNFRRHPQPARIEPIDQARDRLALKIQLLQLQVERSSQPAQRQPVHLEPIELVAVYGDVPQALICPGVLLVNTHADEVRHDGGESVVVIAFHPDYFDMPLGIGELADVSQKFPVIFGEAGEIKVGEDVTQQDQALEAGFPQDARGLARMAHVRTEVQIGEDQRVVHGQIHTLVSSRGMLRGNEYCINIGAYSNQKNNV
jgi:hypothetical protein